MIDLTREKLLSFKEVGEQLPRRRAGRKIHVSTVHRWCTIGLRGVKLDYVQVGSTRCTSLSALRRFFDALDALRDQAPPTNAEPRGRAHEAANRELEREGIS